MEPRNYNLLFSWFVGLNPDDREWEATVFTKNQERWLEGEIAQRLLEAVLAQARAHDLLSEEHFKVDGTLLEAWASRRSFVPKDPPPTAGTEWVERNCCATRTFPAAIRRRGCTRRAGRANPNRVIWDM